MSATDGDRVIDAIEIEVFNNRVLAIIEEMGAKLVRSSFSPNIKERRDCSVALFDVKGRSIGQAAHIPIHLGSLKGGVDAILRDYPLDAIKPGDAFVCNDAYLAGGTHLPDISIITPIFHDGKIKFFAANLGHHSDVGGVVPGSISPSAASIFEEGIRIPPVKMVRKGELDDGVMQLIIQNTREPEDRLLDLKVQIATNELGSEQVLALVERMGGDAIDRAVDDLLVYTARRLKSRIEELKDGSHSFTTWMDDDGFGGDKLPLAATVTVEGDHMHLDFTGSGPQSRGGYNIMPTGVMATVAYTIKALLDPELPANSGLFDAIDFTAPKAPSSILDIRQRSVRARRHARNYQEPSSARSQASYRRRKLWRPATTCLAQWCFPETRKSTTVPTSTWRPSRVGTVPVTPWMVWTGRIAISQTLSTCRRKPLSMNIR